MSSNQKIYTFGVLTLGCKVNQYESEAIAEGLEKLGFVQLPSFKPCDLYILNTCTVTAESDRKSRQMTRRLIQKNPDACVVVTGCSTQAHAEAFAAIPGVCAVVGNREKLRVVQIARQLMEKGKPTTPIVEVPSLTEADFEPMAITRFARARAYVKIQDGCESRCAYCAIPAARGPVRSKPMAEVIAEVTATGSEQSILIDNIHQVFRLLHIDKAAGDDAWTAEDLVVAGIDRDDHCHKSVAGQDLSVLDHRSTETAGIIAVDVDRICFHTFIGNKAFFVTQDDDIAVAADQTVVFFNTRLTGCRRVLYKHLVFSVNRHEVLGFDQIEHQFLLLDRRMTGGVEGGQR